MGSCKLPKHGDANAEELVAVAVLAGRGFEEPTEVYGIVGVRVLAKIRANGAKR
jgi:hypothetical protein